MSSGQAWRRARTRAMGSMLVALGGLLLGLAALASAEGDAHALVNCDVGGHDGLDMEEMTFLALINGYRLDAGLNELTVSTNLNRASAWMAQDLAEGGYFSHTDSLGRSPYQRALDCGYPAGAGENLAAGSGWSTAQAAFEAWKASPGHNSNMLGGYYKQIGIARYYKAGSPYGWYWATNFGAVNDGTGGGGSTPTPTATATPTKTPTAIPTATGTPSPTPTATPTSTATTPAATNTPSPAATATPAKTPSPTPQSSAPSATSTPSATATPTKTATPLATQTSTPTPVPTATPTAQPNSLPLRPGANLVAWPGTDASPQQVFGGQKGSVAIVYAWDPATGTWKRYGPELPGFVNNLATMRYGEAYWVIAKGTASLPISK